MADNEGHSWDWGDDAGDVVVEAQPGIAVYAGPAGVVIRRQGDWDEHDDGLVWFGIEHARAVASAILDVAGYEASAPAPKPDGGKSKNNAGAQRQRRYRESKKKDPAPEPALFERDAVTAAERDTVTDGVTDTVTDTVTRDGEAA